MHFYAERMDGMTEFQAEQIENLRKQGVGYRSIGTIVGLSRDIVRNYCKSKGLDGYASDITVNIQEQMALGKACWCCGKPIAQTRTGRPRKFCSDRCRRTWWAAHPEAGNHKAEATYHMTCAYCGKPFISYGNKNRKYCSHPCYIRDRFWREEDGREPYVKPARKEERHE